MSIPDAIKTKEGAIYLAGAALAGLLALVNFATTVTSHLHQEAMREAVHAFASGKSQARQLLGDLRTSGAGSPDDQATVHVLLGAFNYDRAHVNPQLLQTAERLFERALEISPDRTSAAVGLVCVRLSQAEGKDREARAREARQAEAELDRLVGPGDIGPDVQYLRGAIQLVQGNVDKAIRSLNVEPEEAPSREGLGARYWNLGVAELLGGRPKAFEHFSLGYQLRPMLIPNEFKPKPADAEASKTRAGDAPYLLSTIFRVGLTLQTAEPAELKARCDDASGRMRPFSRGVNPLNKGQLGPFLPHRWEVHPLHNALGVAYFKAGDLENSVKQFDVASQSLNHKEPLYLLNLAWSLYRHAKSLPKEQKDKLEIAKRSAQVFAQVSALLHTQPGRENTVRMARTNSAAIWIMLGEGNIAKNVYEKAASGDPNEAETRRDLGALFDYMRDKGRALSNYRRALELQHPDSAEIENRVRYWESR